MTSLPTTFERLPPWLRPRDAEAPGSGRRRRLIESAVLIAVGLLLAAAVTRDVVRQVGVDQRVVVDKRTWVHYTHRNIKLVPVLTNTRNNVDFACGLPHPHATYRFCLMLTGPSHTTYRHVAGGYRLQLTGFDVRANRYDCFGQPRRERLCARRGGVG